MLVMKEDTLHYQNGLARLVCPVWRARTMFNANSRPLPRIAVLLLTSLAQNLFLVCLQGQAVCLFPR
jgi:hypothetical protein